MKGTFLVTVWGETRIKSFSFDPESQSVRYMGLDDSVDAGNAFACIELIDNDVVVKPEGDAVLYAPTSADVPVRSVVLDTDAPVVLGARSPRCNGLLSIFIRPATLGIGRFERLRLCQDAELVIGRSNECALHYDCVYVSARHARLTYADGLFVIEDLKSGNGTFVNGRKLSCYQPRWLVPGDTVQILDLTVMVGKGFLLTNHPAGLGVRSDALVRHGDGVDGAGVAYVKHGEGMSSGRERPSRTMSPTQTTFYPAPRLVRSVHPLTMSIDAPPQRSLPQDMPALLQVGPSFLMGLTSVFMAASCVSTLLGGGQALQVLPTLAMSVGMLGGSVVWPLVSRSYNRKRDVAREHRRCEMYVAYLDSVENKLQAEADLQSAVLRENRLSVETLLSRARDMSSLLMNRTSEHEDFMDLRVGVGDCELEVDLAWPKRSFSLVDDPMMGRVERLSQNSPSLRDVPLCFNPLKNRVTGVLGEEQVVWEFLRGLLVQICSYYSYREVKTVLITRKSEYREWAFLSSLGHAYYEGDRQRLVALTNDGMLAKDALLESELSATNVHGDRGVDATAYYMLVCTNVQLANKSDMVTRILSGRVQERAMLIYAGGELSDLPKDCNYIIDLSPGGRNSLGTGYVHALAYAPEAEGRACMFDRTDVSGTLRTFTPDILVTREAANDFALQMARLHLDDSRFGGSMPESLGFLEMYEVGNAAHLNILQRWAENDASRSLQAAVGKDAHGEQAFINLHEDAYGPHGLIAGTTGSGKSEFIITYILSLCVNYAPDEVSFVIIDYKGGGLAGAFCNERYRLPHLAGAITNLDGSSIGRSLVSIKSELKRRQEAFNDAREKTGEATMDIYKYLAFYRQGMLSDSLPHLFIVADEFAELKQQEPEFMDELVSAARIGRSLGVHLILATQKPSGVVDGQIWSNARLKISLKVADATDSREMIRRDDAAKLTRPGEFLLLVGYDESFWSGQAAYAGLPYVAKDRFEPRRDNAVELLDMEGRAVASLKPSKSVRRHATSELCAVLEQIEHASKTSGKRARRLWLDPLPDQVFLAEMRHIYGSWRSEALVCVVGEADDPANQRRFLYSLDLTRVGNVMLYGSSSSGVDQLLASMAFSMAMEWGCDELWLYGVDCGEGQLGMLKRLNHTGDVVLAGDDEGLRTLLRMLEAEVSHRRLRMAAPHQGGVGCSDADGEVAPRIVVCLANLASLLDLHADIEERLVSLARDAPRCGIHFLVSAASFGAVRMRLRANFGAHVPTMMNDVGDYLSILGSLGGVTPPQQERRGLTKIGKSLYEFQGVSIGKTNEDVEELIKMCANQSNGLDCACPPPIPRLPQHVLAEHMSGVAGERRLPVGYAKISIEPLCLDLHKTPCAMVLGNDTDALKSYVRGMYETLSQWAGATYTFVDPLGALERSDDSHVLGSLSEVATFVEGLLQTGSHDGVLVFTNVVQTLERLEDETSARLKEYLARTAGSGEQSLVVVSEFWRTKSLYEDWYRAVCAYGCGVWVGGGFGDQTAFHYVRQLPEFQKKASESDGFAVMGGEVTPVRLIGPRA